MGLLEFNKLPINTLVGADWKTFNAITKGREIDEAYKGKYRLKDMFEQAVTRAKTDPRYEEYSKICELDYDLLCSTCKYDKLYRCEFDVVGEVTYGSSEGIYGDIFLYGNWSKERDDPFKSRARVYVLKTLKQDKESYLAVGMLVNLICYYANEFVATHLDRFD